MRLEGQANWLVHEIAHLHLSHSVATVLESVHSGTINSTLLQSIPPVNNPLNITEYKYYYNVYIGSTEVL